MVPMSGGLGGMKMDGVPVVRVESLFRNRMGKQRVDREKRSVCLFFPFHSFSRFDIFSLNDK
jgi:hypothetical protein